MGRPKSKFSFKLTVFFSSERVRTENLMEPFHGTPLGFDWFIYLLCLCSLLRPPPLPSGSRNTIILLKCICRLHSSRFKKRKIYYKVLDDLKNFWGHQGNAGMSSGQKQCSWKMTVHIWDLTSGISVLPLPAVQHLGPQDPGTTVSITVSQKNKTLPGTQPSPSLTRVFIPSYHKCSLLPAPGSPDAWKDWKLPLPCSFPIPPLFLSFPVWSHTIH